MPLLNKIPKIDRCCGCVTDLKVAAAIIAVLGIVTSPIISWAIVRHAYVIRVTCVVTTNISRPDVIDINFQNALRFGFGANTGLGPSCLSTTSGNDAATSRSKSSFVQFVRFSGWVVLLADIAFLIGSVNFLIKICKGLDKQASLVFIGTCLLSIILSFVYGLLYVSACLYVGGGFPVFEFFFAMIDLITLVGWVYFIIVINSYYQLTPSMVSVRERFIQFITLAFLTLYGYLINFATICFGYIFLFNIVSKSF